MTHESETWIHQEPMASLMVRSILWDTLRSVDISQAAPRIVVATPVGHRHAFGALASALAVSGSGWRVSYFGPNLPCEEVAYAVKKLKARALALSLGHVLHDNRLMLTISEMSLRKKVAAGNGMAPILNYMSVGCVGFNPSVRNHRAASCDIGSIHPVDRF